MALERVTTFAGRNPRTFYWWVIVPLQSLLISAFAAPLYGFNAFIGPLDKLFGTAGWSSWLGATCGGLLLFGGGCGALVNGWLIKRAGGASRLLIVLCFVTIGLFGVGALACYWKSQWLLILGFAVPTGLVFSNVYTMCTVHVMSWAGVFGRSGLQSGVIGLCFGFWGAIYSFVGPGIIADIGPAAMLMASGVFVGGMYCASWLFFVPAPVIEDDTAAQGAGDESRVIGLKLGQLLMLAPFWLFFIYFLFFLTPGFGFKIIVQVLSTKVFDAGVEEASLIAVAFLACYGLSRLFFGYVSDKLATRPMYLSFTLVQCVCLFVAAVTLPAMESVVVFSVLMCLVGTVFAAGKCIWMVLLLKIYGKENLHLAMCATLPAYGLAGLIGPVSLNAMLQGHDIVKATSGWLYVMGALLVICILLILMLKRVDYTRLKQGKAQPLSLSLRGGDALAKF